MPVGGSARTEEQPLRNLRWFVAGIVPVKMPVAAAAPVTVDDSVITLVAPSFLKTPTLTLAAVMEPDKIPHGWGAITAPQQMPRLNSRPPFTNELTGVPPDACR